MVDRMATLTEVSRGFEALQKGVSVLMNDLDGARHHRAGDDR